MNVAFIFLHPFAGSLGSTLRVRELTSHLVNFNVESIIFTPYEKSQNLSQGVSVLSTGGLLNKIGLTNHVYRLTKFVYYNSFFIKHFLCSQKLQARLAKSNAAPILKALKQKSVEIIQVEQDFAIPTGIEVKKKTGLPLIADIHNITTEELVASGAIKRDSAEFNKLQTLIKNNLSQVDEIVVVSDLMRDYVVANYDVDAKHVHVVPPGGNPYKITKKTLKHPRVVYSGLVAYREHVDLFVRSIPIIKEKKSDVEFYITDKGENVNAIKRLAKQLQVAPVFFYYPEKEDFINFLASCTVGVLPSSDDLARQMGTPAKLFEYLAVGLPVAANDVGAWSTMIREENVGEVTDNTPEGFANAILSLIESAKSQEYITHCQSIITNKCSWAKSAHTLSQIYNLILTNNTTTA